MADKQKIVFDDGDSGKVNGSRFRLAGIDAPETPKDGLDKGWNINGLLAAKVSEDSVGDSRIVRRGYYDDYGRQLVDVESTNGGLTAREKLIRAGIAGVSISDKDREAGNVPDDVKRAVGKYEYFRLMGKPDEDKEVADLAEANRLLLSIGLENDLKYNRSLPNTHIKTTNSKSTFGRAWDRGIDQMQGNLYNAGAAIGDVIGSESMVEWGERGAQRNEVEAYFNPAEVGSIDDVHSFGDGITYIVERIGEELPGLAVDAGAAAATAATGGAAGVVMGGLNASKWAARGAKIGMAASATAQNTGDAYDSMGIGGVEDNKGLYALGTGAVMGALDYVGLDYGVKAITKPLGITDKITDEVADNVIKAGLAYRAKDILAATGKTALSEGVTESLQEAVKDAGVTVAGGDTEKLGSLAGRMKESFFAGAAVGGGIAGAGRTAHHGYDYLTRKNEAKIARDNQADDDKETTFDNVHVNSRGATVEGQATADYSSKFNDVEDEKGFSQQQAQAQPEPDVEPEAAQSEPASEPEPEPEVPQPEPEYGVEQPQPEPDYGPLPEQEWQSEPVVEQPQPEPVPEPVPEPEPMPEPKKAPSHSFNAPKGYNLRKVVESALKNDGYVPESIRKDIENIATGGNTNLRITHPDVRESAVSNTLRDPDAVQRIYETIDRHIAEAGVKQRPVRDSMNGLAPDSDEYKAKHQELRALEREQSALSEFRDRVKSQHARGELNFDHTNKKAGGTVQGAAAKTLTRDIIKSVDPTKTLDENTVDSVVENLAAQDIIANKQIYFEHLKDAVSSEKFSTEHKALLLNRLREFSNALAHRDDARLKNIIDRHYSNSRRNRDLLFSLMTTKAKNLEEFTQEYADGKMTPEQVYDRIDDAYLVDRFKATLNDDGKTVLYTSQDDGIRARIDGTAVKTPNLDVKPTTSNALEAPAHERPEAIKDGNATAELDDYIKESVHQLLWNGNAAREAETGTEYTGEGKKDSIEVEKERETVLASRNGFDFNNPRRLEAIQSATENPDTDEKTITNIYESLRENLPDEMRSVKMTKSGKVPVHLIKNALSKDLPKIIERRDGNTDREFGDALARQIDRGLLAGAIHRMTPRKDNGDVDRSQYTDNLRQLEGIVNRSLNTPESDITDLAGYLNTSPENLRKVFDVIDNIAMSYAIDRRKPRDGQSKDNFQAQQATRIVDDIIRSQHETDPEFAPELERLLRKEPVINAVNEALNARQKPVFSKFTLDDAIEQLNKQDLSEMLPEQIQARLIELSILPTPEKINLFANPIHTVNRHARVSGATPTGERLRLRMNDGTVKQVRLSTLVSAVSGKLSEHGYGSPARLLVDSVEQAIGTLLDYKESTGRAFVDVASTINALPDSTVIYRDFEGNTRTVADYRTARDRLKAIENGAVSTTPFERTRDTAHKKMLDKIKTVNNVFKGLHTEANDPFGEHIDRIAEQLGVNKIAAREQLRNAIVEVKKNLREQGQIDDPKQAKKLADNARNNAVTTPDDEQSFLARGEQHSYLLEGWERTPDELQKIIEQWRTLITTPESQLLKGDAAKYEKLSAAHNKLLRTTPAEVIHEALQHVNDEIRSKAQPKDKTTPNGRRQTTINDIVNEALERDGLNPYAAEGEDIFDDLKTYATILHDGSHQDTETLNHAREMMSDITDVLKSVSNHLSKLNIRDFHNRPTRESAYISGEKAHELANRIREVTGAYYIAREAQQNISNTEKRDIELQQINGVKRISTYTEERSLNRDTEAEESREETQEPAVGLEALDHAFDTERGVVLEESEPVTRYMEREQRLSVDKARSTILQNRKYGSELLTLVTETEEFADDGGFIEPRTMVSVERHRDGHETETGDAFDEADTESVDKAMAAHRGKIALHYGDNTLPNTARGLLTIDVKAMANAAGFSAYTDGDIGDLYFAVFKRQSDNNGKALVELANYFTDRALEPTSDNTPENAPELLTTDQENFFEDNDRIRFFTVGRQDGAQPRAAFTDKTLPKLRDKYKQIYDLIKAAGISQQTNVLMKADMPVIDSHVYTTRANGQVVYNVVVPGKLDTDTAIMALGHEIGHIILDTYRSAYAQNALPFETRAKFADLYRHALESSDTIDKEKFADSYAQLFLEQLLGSTAEVDATKVDPGSLMGNIIKRLRDVGQSIARYLNDAVKRFGAVTGRRNIEVNTDEHKAFLKKVVEGRSALDSYARDMNERLVGDGALKNGKVRGKTILHHLNLFRHLRPMYSRLKSVSPAIAEMFLSTKGADGYQNVKHNLQKGMDGDEGRPAGLRSKDKKVGKKVEQGYKDMLEGRDTAESQLLRQWLDNIEAFVKRQLDPNGINSYGAKDFKVKLPFRLHPTEVQRHEAQIRQTLKDLGIQHADLLVDAAIHETDLELDATTSWSAVLSNVKNREALSKYMDVNGVTVMNNYIHNITHQFAMRQAFGAHVRTADGSLMRNESGDVMFRPMRKLNRYVEQLNANEVAVVAESLRVLNGDYESLYPYMKRTPEPVRKVFETVNMVGNLAVLTFAGLNNVMDVAIPLISSGDIGTSLNSLRTFLRSTDREQLSKFAHAIGVVEYGVMKNTMSALAFGRNRTGIITDKMADVYFKVTLMEYTTKMSRMVATSVGVQGIEDALNNPDNRNRQAFLEKIGLSQRDAAIAREHIARNGGDINAVFNTELVNDPVTLNALNNYRNAVSNFVSFSTLDPNVVTDPMLASNPRFLLLVNLKRFFYAFHHTVLKGTFNETARRFNEANGLSDYAGVAVPILSAALFMLPFSLFSWWMREWVRDGDIEKGNPFDKPLDELLLGAYQRAGVLGLGDIYYNAEQATEYGAPWWLSATPSLSTFYQTGEALMEGKYDKAARRIIPLYDKTYLTSPKGLWKSDE